MRPWSTAIYVGILSIGGVGRAAEASEVLAWMRFGNYRSNNCAKISEEGSFIRWVDLDRCRREIGSFYAWKNFHGTWCGEFTPSGGWIRWAPNENCRAHLDYNSEKMQAHKESLFGNPQSN